MTLPAVHASLTHLISGQDRNKAAISDAIDAVVSAHAHGGKATFDERVTDLRSAVESAFLTMDAIHDTARTAVGLPTEPRVEIPAAGATILREAQSAEDAAANRRSRTARAAGTDGE